MTPTSKHVNLQRLILALATLSALVMLGNAAWASYQVQRQQLVDSTLETNRVYAQKLAHSTHHFLTGAQQQLAYSASQIGATSLSSARPGEEAKRLREQTEAFNSVVVVDESGRVLSTAPYLPELHGTTLTSDANRLALASRAPAVSEPYVASTGRLIVSISHPIFDSSGDYVGYITASIHLKDRNVLHSLLGQHYYRDGSYLYVVDRRSKLIYHPEPHRVGELAIRNAVVKAVTRGEAGALHTINSHGVHMLAGFAPVPASGWGIVAQRPVTATLVPLQHLMRTVLLNAAPFGLLSLVLIWFFSRRIASPLWQLAKNTQSPDVGQAIAKVTAVNSWYYEAAQLRRAVLVSFRTLSEKIGRLDQAALTDPLTGLLNRKGLDRAMGEVQESSLPFGIVTFDVDHFKNVNDRFGHPAGDQVIIGIAQLMRDNARGEDILCRIGGEEFLILLPGIDSLAAAQVGERLRESIRAHIFPSVGHVTISVGIAHCPQTHTDPDLALRQADKALYKAKQQGRDQVVLHRKRSQETGAE